MKNTIPIVAFILFITAIFAQKPAFNTKFSEPLAVLVFLENLSPNHPENSFKTAVNASKYNMRIKG